MPLISPVMYISTLIFCFLHTETCLAWSKYSWHTLNQVNISYKNSIDKYQSISFCYIILIQLFYWVMRKNWMFQLLSLSHFRPMFHLCRNQVVGFYLQNLWKTPVEEWHFASKNQLPGLSVGRTLVENGLINQIFLLILPSQQWYIAKNLL